LKYLLAGCAIGAAMFTFNPPAEAQDRRVRVINNTGQIMVRLQASNVNRRTWEEDILGRNVLRPGQATMANLDDGSGQCLFDLRATFAGGATATRRRVNICQITSWTIND
jgi:hypothetical protein